MNCSSKHTISFNCTLPFSHVSTPMRAFILAAATNQTDRMQSARLHPPSPIPPLPLPHRSHILLRAPTPTARNLRPQRPLLLAAHQENSRGRRSSHKPLRSPHPHPTTLASRHLRHCALHAREPLGVRVYPVWRRMVQDERSYTLGIRRAEEIRRVLEDGASDGKGNEEGCSECVCVAETGGDKSSSRRWI